jgi:hypothetical protein
VNDVTRDPQPLLRAFNERLKRPRAHAAISEARWSYRCAASVLHCFRPADLKPDNPSLVVENPYLLLTPDIVPATGGRAGNFQTLRPDVRKDSLNRLKTAERMRMALACNPGRIHTDLQNMLEAWLIGSAIPLAEQSYAELRLSYQVAEWLDGLVPGVPPLSEIAPIMARRSVLASVEHLVLGEFVGRDQELQQLSDYVGVLSPTLLESLRRGVRWVFNIKERPPLVMTGPGGIGKSALIGRFLYDHATVPEDRRFPFAYLPFDNPSLKIDDPFTLLVDAVSQFELQYPDKTPTFQSFRDQVKSYRDRRGQIGDRSVAFSTVRDRLEAVHTANEVLYAAFTALLRALTEHSNSTPPALLVLDTFEEIEYRSPEELTGLWQMLGAVQRGYPGLRVIISGRRVSNVVVNGNAATQFPLPPLRREASEQLLQKLGVIDPQIAAAVANQVGGNPLTLRLAARVLETERGTAAGISQLTTRTWYLATLSEELIRGQLYRRILNHIHDEDVRKLAHPGMVLRRLNPEIIRQVLSPICGVDAHDPKAAQVLFDQVKKEHTLVWLEEDGSLHYRPEIRGPMLKLLAQDKPYQAREIHEAAVSYYQRLDTSEARAEELYHRLMLNQDSTPLQARWMDAAGSSIAASLDDLPPRAAAWLASRMSLNISKEIRQSAATEEWERQAARSVRDATRYLDWKGALKTLGERKDRSPGSPLFALEARAHLLAGNYEAAAQSLDAGIASTPLNANRGRFVELLWMRAGVAAQLGQIVQSDTYLEQAQQTAFSITNPLCRVQILTERLVTRQRWPQLPMSDPAPIRDKLVDSLSGMDDALVDQQRGLVRNAIAFLGGAYPVTFRRLLVVVGLGEITNEQLRSLAASLAAVVPTLPLLEPWASPDSSALILIDKTNMDPHVLDGIASLLRQSLGTAATALLGIEEYREPWELEAAADVR